MFIFDYFTEAIANALAFFYSLPVVGGSYGRAIIMLTLAVMVVMMPLTLRATRSAIAMAEMQPKIRSLQKKYKDDRPALNAELMKVYKEHKINPVGGCLPMIAQMPVFFILFRILRGLAERIEDQRFYGFASSIWEKQGDTTIKGESFFPDFVSESTVLYEDLRQDTKMGFGPFDLGVTPLEAIQNNLLTGMPYILLLAFVVATAFYQQKQIQARRGANPAAINPLQKSIMKFLPFMSGIFGFGFPAGLVLYWSTSNSFRVAQQAFITKKYYSDNQDTSIIDVEEVLDDDDEEEIEVETKAKKKVSKREQEWQKRREQKAAQASKKKNSSSKRITPKGTKPSQSKRKR